MEDKESDKQAKNTIYKITFYSEKNFARKILSNYLRFAKKKGNNPVKLQLNKESLLIHYFTKNKSNSVLEDIRNELKPIYRNDDKIITKVTKDHTNLNYLDEEHRILWMAHFDKIKKKPEEIINIIHNNFKKYSIQKNEYSFIHLSNKGVKEINVRWISKK